MMSGYEISVIVPVYNKETYLPRCMDSLIGQSYEHKEILLVDDGSTDQSGKLCDEYAGNYEFVKVLHKENGGLISAWKAGVNHASGSYVMFVDGDDWVDKTMLSEMAEHLSGSDREIILSDYVIERTGKKGKSQEYVYQTLASGEYKEEAIRKDLIPELMGNELRLIAASRCMKLFSRRLIEDNMGFCDEKIRMGEDSTITLPAIMDAERIFNMDHKAYYHYDFVESSMIHQYDPNSFENVKSLYAVLQGMLGHKFEGERLTYMYDRLDREFIFLMLYVLKNEIRNPDPSYRSVIRRICRSREVKDIVDRTRSSIRVSELSNRLLYTVLTTPNLFTITVLRLAMKVYYAGK